MLMSVIPQEELQKIFADNGYRICKPTSVTPEQFTKNVLGNGGISYALTWYVTTEDCHKFGTKTTYSCMFITGEWIYLTINREVLDIGDVEKVASDLFKTGLFKQFETFTFKAA